MEMKDQLQAAQKTLGGLQKQRATITERKSEIDVERGRIAFAAHARSDKKAVERLAELESEEGDLDRRAKGIDAAIRTAQSEVDARQDALKAAEQAAERAARMARIQSCADQLQSAGESASEAMAVFVGAMNRIKVATDALHADGVLSASQMTMARINLPFAVKSELITAGLLEPIVPRSQRTTIAKMVGNYAASALRAAQEFEPKVAGTTQTSEPAKEAA